MSIIDSLLMRKQGSRVWSGMLTGKQNHLMGSSTTSTLLFSTNRRIERARLNKRSNFQVTGGLILGTRYIKNPSKEKHETLQCKSPNNSFESNSASDPRSRWNRISSPTKSFRKIFIQLSSMWTLTATASWICRPLGSSCSSSVSLNTSTMMTVVRWRSRAGSGPRISISWTLFRSS